MDGDRVVSIDTIFACIDISGHTPIPSSNYSAPRFVEVLGVVVP